MFFFRSRPSAERKPPFRAQVFSKDLLAARAAELGEFYSHVQRTGRGAKLQRRFKENTQVLRDAYFSFSAASRNKEVLTAGAEWLLDNYHLIDEQVRDIRRDLPRGYYRALPKLTDAEWRGFPRVYRIVCDFLSHTDSVVDTEYLTTFITAYQSKTVLLIGEIWAVPIMLRLALVENLRRLAEESLAVAEMRRRAERICQEIIDPAGSAGADMLIGLVHYAQADPELFHYGAAHLMRRLRAKGGPATLALQWFDQQLRERGVDAAELGRLEQQSQAADQMSVGNSITALRTIANLNWREWFEEVSLVHQVLLGDPAAVYSRSDFVTRDLYRHRIERLARRSKKTEVEVAEQTVKIASEAVCPDPEDTDQRWRHVGFYLIDDGIKQLEQALHVSATLRNLWRKRMKENIFFLYSGCILSVVVAGLVFLSWYALLSGGSWLYIPAIIILFSIPLSEFGIQAVQWCVTKVTSPVPLPKLDYDEGIPDEARAAVVVQTMFPDMDSVDKAVEALEIRAIGNLDQNLAFGVLADLLEASSEVLPGDVGVIHRAKELIAELNEQYFPGKAPRFFVMIRKRVWNEKEGKFMPWERKRGKIMEFNRLLRGGKETTFAVIDADLAFLQSCKYIITLDADTQLPRGVARKLVGTIAHPLNSAVFDKQTDVVVRGYSIIQPRVGITLQSGNASLFASIYSGHSGLDPYTRTVSDVYQDLFKEGSYIGKGVYSIDAFERALSGRFPENALLSHDLIESVFARCGLASDIEVFDEYPMRYHAQAKRQHRWMRGDWQLLPWMSSMIPNERGAMYPSPISQLGRWKLVDNLRRGLYPLLLLASLLAVWTCFPGSQLVWLGAVLLLSAFPILAIVWRLIFDLPFGYSFSSFFYQLGTDTWKQLSLLGLHFAFLPHQAYIGADAMAVTIYRLYFSRRHLLEWETAYATERRMGGALRDFISAMKNIYPITLGAFVVLFAVHQPETALTAPFFLAAWLASPLMAWWVSRPLRNRANVKLGDAEASYLSQTAFATWKYFDHFLKPEYNYLIPDNLQIVPRRVVAERTSPTNISLSMLSVVSAYDLGFIPLGGVIRRISGTFTALTRLERFKGHFLNWYSIRDLRPLYPRYISTVDSGNFVGHLIAIKEAQRLFPYSPLMGPKHVQHLRVLLERLTSMPKFSYSVLESSAANVENLEELIAVLRCLEGLHEELVGDGASGELRRVLEEYTELGRLTAWAKHLPLLAQLGRRELLPKKLKDVSRILRGRVPSLSLILKITNRLFKVQDVVDLSRLNEAEKTEFARFITDLKLSNEMARELLRANADVLRHIETLVRETDFKFLCDPQKKLFTIGYNVDKGQKDNSYYDLLASEARLGIFVAIAKGDVPQSYWFMLDRSLTQAAGGKALLSWSGTMFEYLMPLLVMREFPPTLLSGTYDAVVKTQRIYARRRGVPWGISESAYSGVDFEKTYQYRAFGVPGLGLKRGLAEDLVISPYSTMMALILDARAALSNLRRLEEDGLRGEFGFYEAVDYTSERLGAEEKRHVIKSFLAHHQGMTLVSINNALNKGIFQRRFHANPSIKACELLLQERFPTRIPVLQPHQAEILSLSAGDREGKAEPTEHFRTPHTRYPRTRLLSNGRYSLLIDNGGGGVSFMDSDIALTRWREDSLRNIYGTFVYIRDISSRAYWSAGYQPVCSEPERYEAVFSPDKAEFRRRDRSLTTQMEVTVSPEDNIEVRRLTIGNLSNRPHELDVTSYGEVCLAPFKADLAHPAFLKLFVYSEFLEEYGALLFCRRPRGENEKPLWLMHMVVAPNASGSLQFETARRRFIGRGGTLRAPLAMQNLSPLPRSVGQVLDPIFSLRVRLDIRQGESETVNFITGTAGSREEILALVRKFGETHHISRAFELAWSHSDVELRHQLFSISRVRDFQRLANAIYYNIEKLRAPADILKKNKLGQSALWRFGIGGDDPIVLAVINDPEQLKLAEEVLLAHEYLRLRGLRFDLVILNDYPGGYLQDLQQQLDFMIKSGVSANLVEKHGGIYLRSLTQLSPEEVNLLYAVARVVLQGSGGPLSVQLDFTQNEVLPKPRRRPATRKEEYAFRPSQEVLEFPNGFGGFSEDGKAYSMIIRHDTLPPAPWSNVVSNKQLGFVVTESGGGFTWAGNSRENRLSPWSNDPVRDPLGEVLYIRDPQTGNYWCPTPRPVRHGQPVKVKHAFGYSEFSTQISQVFSSLIVSAASEEPVKWWHLELVNGDFQERHLEIFLYFEWVLGVSREETSRRLITAYEPQHQFLYAVNPFNADCPEQVIFMGSSQQVASFTTSRAEFVGRHHDLSAPAALEEAAPAPGIGGLFAGGRSPVSLKGTVGAGFDSCCALKIQVTLEPGQKQQVLFFAAKADSIAQAQAQAVKYKSLRSWSNAFEAAKRLWSITTGRIQVHTPDRRFDIMVNGWLLYQTLSCRINGRTGFYQSSGAIGFRDQLQDSLALLQVDPQQTKEQILLHAGRQFPEGDVQHWWHPPTGRGIRTRISDNYLWLPFAVEQYLTITGDASILDEYVSFIEAPQLDEKAAESYETPRLSSRRASLFDHCLLALDRSMLVGRHGLPLMGSGDWNDGFNMVGIGGQGESVWLAWFSGYLLEKFAPLLEARGDPEKAQVYRSHARALAAAVERTSWDGAWYRRAYFDDGSPIGSAANEECKIDSLVQSWAVISGLGSKERRSVAVQSALSHLINADHRLLLLLTPPFISSHPSPGYIQAYPPGIRENGGQYTHAAAWLVLACAMLGEGNRAFEMFQMINPITHGDSAEAVAKYRAEPYVTCGDVYSEMPHAGRGGWSWYTGSSGWLYRTAVEHLAGLQIRGDHFTVSPCIPASWREFVIEYRAGKTDYRITVQNPNGVMSGVESITAGGETVPDGRITILPEHGGTIEVLVTMGSGPAAG